MKVDFLEESGKGVPTIVEKYGASVFEFGSFYLKINISFNQLAMEDEKLNGVINGAKNGADINLEVSNEVTHQQVLNQN